MAGNQIVSTDYQLTAKTSDFGSLIAGASITVDSVAYTVREVRKFDDGAFCSTVSLTGYNTNAGDSPLLNGTTLLLYIRVLTPVVLASVVSNLAIICSRLVVMFSVLQFHKMHHHLTFLLL